MEIKHLRRSEIDIALWDKIVSNAKNNIIYAYSWFLDCVSPNWEALVSANYEYIMPLPVKTRFGIKYIIQPILTQQLGVFSCQLLSESIIEKFVNSIPYFSYEMNLNEKNYIKNSLEFPNLLLELNTPYEKLIKEFSANTLRNIKKAESNSLKIDWNINTYDFIQFYFAEEKHFGLPDKNITQKLIKVASEHKQIQIIGVKSKDNQLLAALGLFISGCRLIYLLPSSSKLGKEKSAMFFLVNELIKNYSSSDVILDFEGSKIKGVARFYESFGAKYITYYIIKRFRPKFLIR